jgi:hypothetical protein
LSRFRAGAARGDRQRGSLEVAERQDWQRGSLDVVERHLEGTYLLELDVGNPAAAPIQPASGRGSLFPSSCQLFFRVPAWDVEIGLRVGRRRILGGRKRILRSRTIPLAILLVEIIE